MENSQEVSLTVDGRIFQAKKEILCEHSDYFRAMFNGSYVERGKTEIKISIVDANSMDILLRYMEIGLIDLSEYSLFTMGNLAIAANFLQITEIIKQIEYCLEIQLSPSNWLETMSIAENSSYKNLEQMCAVFGLLSFKSMKPEYIPNIHKLFWYLSHPYLDASNELDIFKLGLQWILDTETGADALLIILGCLDLKRVTSNELKEINFLVKDYVNSLAVRVIECLFDLSINNYELSELTVMERKSVICEKFTERVYNEVLSMVRTSRKRLWNYTPVVPMSPLKNTKLELVPHNLYSFNEKVAFEKWIEVAEKNLWGWNIATWTGFKVVLVCGEHGRGASAFMKDVKVYDTLKKEWTIHGVQLPSRRHGGVAINGDLLYIIGGVGGFRLILDKAIVYNLKERTYRRIANLPETIQNPAVCVHDSMVYTAGQRNIYRYEDMGERDRWVTVIPTDFRINSMISFKNSIYCTQNYFNQLYRFKPDVDKNLEIVTYFTNPPAAVCNLGDRLLFMTRELCESSPYHLAVEEYTENNSDSKPKVLWSDTNAVIRINDVAGSCSVVMSAPPIKFDISSYHRQYLMRYAE